MSARELEFLYDPVEAGGRLDVAHRTESVLFSREQIRRRFTDWELAIGLGPEGDLRQLRTDQRAVEWDGEPRWSAPAGKVFEVENGVLRPDLPGGGAYVDEARDRMAVVSKLGTALGGRPLGIGDPVPEPLHQVLVDQVGPIGVAGAWVLAGVVASNDRPLARFVFEPDPAASGGVSGLAEVEVRTSRLRRYRIQMEKPLEDGSVGLLRQTGTLRSWPAGPAAAVHPSLALVAREGDLGRVKQLLADGVSPTRVGPRGFTPLQQAALGGHVDVLRTLLEAGADLHDRGEDGRTPLQLALVADDPAAVRFLLERGATVSSREFAPAHRELLASFGDASVRTFTDADADRSGASIAAAMTGLAKQGFDVSASPGGGSRGWAFAFTTSWGSRLFRSGELTVEFGAWDADRTDEAGKAVVRALSEAGLAVRRNETDDSVRVDLLRRT
ncbi:MAG: ankyrin repeat domain-containing protein [Myxococcota bacterium]